MASTLFPTFNAPDWVLKVFVTLMFLGFPVAILMAYPIYPAAYKSTLTPFSRVIIRAAGRSHKR